MGIWSLLQTQNRTHLLPKQSAASSNLSSRSNAPIRQKDRLARLGVKGSCVEGRGYGGRLLWLGLHLVWLIGFRNRLLVLVNWGWNYLTYERAVRLIRH